jgi:hypothetical protein
MNGPSPEEYAPLIRRDKADDVFEKNAFAAAALADDRRNLLFVNYEICLVENSLFVKALGDISEFYQGRFHRGLYIRKEVTT